MLINLLQADSNAVAESVLAQAPTEQTMSIIDLAMKGGWLMIVLLILSIIAIYIFGKKCFAINAAAKMDKNFMEDIRDYVHEGKIKSAKTLCERYDTPVARVVEKGLGQSGKTLADIQAATETAATVEVGRIEKGLPYLAMISGGAPMIGFLGTVTGMIEAFFKMANAGSNVDISLLSGGIYTAMITTAGGLIVGILAYFGYNYLTTRVSDIVYKMEKVTGELVDIYSEPAKNEAE